MIKKIHLMKNYGEWLYYTFSEHLKFKNIPSTFSFLSHSFSHGFTSFFFNFKDPKQKLFIDKTSDLIGPFTGLLSRAAWLNSNTVLHSRSYQQVTNENNISYQHFLFKCCYTGTLDRPKLQPILAWYTCTITLVIG